MTEAEKTLEDMSVCVLTAFGLGCRTLTLPFISHVSLCQTKSLGEAALKVTHTALFKHRYITVNIIPSLYFCVIIMNKMET